MKAPKTLFFTLFLLLFSVAGHTQEKSKKERIRTLKVAYITEKLSLTTEEAQKLWPIYNTYYDNVSELWHQEHKNIKKPIRNGDIDNMSEAEANLLLAELEDIESKIYKENVQLTRNLKGVLPAKKILLLKRAERDFSRELLHKLKRQEDHKKQ
ncbi:sensor of ECF-type sigma factor [Sinomicrobium sp. M5D2P9]